jgi:glycerophosphoryl diester phosphodiesterase
VAREDTGTPWASAPVGGRLGGTRGTDAVNARRPPGARMRYLVWTINDPEEMCALVRLGVDGLITDEPGHLSTIVRHWGRPGTCPP